MYSRKPVMQHRQEVQPRNYNLIYDNVRHNYKVERSEYQYPRKQVLTMGVEIPLAPSHSFAPIPRKGRGGSSTNWRERSYDQPSSHLAVPEQSGCCYYNHVPNLMQKNNVWNTKTKKSATRSDQYQRHMNPSGDYVCNDSTSDSDYQNGSEELAAGYPVEIGNRDYYNKRYSQTKESSARAVVVYDPNIKNKQPQKPQSKNNTVKSASVRPETQNAKNSTGKRRNQTQRQFPAPSGAHRAIRGRCYNVSEPPSISPEPIVKKVGVSDDVHHIGAHKEVKYLPKPDHLFTGGQWDKLSDGVWKNFVIHQQSDVTFGKKLRTWRCLRDAVKASFAEYGLFLVGSTMTGFGSDMSDMDLCLLVRQTHMDQRSEAVVHLERVRSALENCDFVVNPVMIQAKVPILKFLDKTRTFEVDLNCNNIVGIRNTHLQYCYSQLDWRVRPLVLIVKLWAHIHKINDAKYMTISSYSLVLMVINFLQCGVCPPVLPCLHDIFPEKFNSESDVDQIDIHENLDHDFVSSNEQTLGELLHDFLAYYVDFKYSEFAISVRLAARIPIEDCRQAQTYKNDPHQWKYLCVEEPFDLTNTARSVYDPEVFESVKSVFAISLDVLQRNNYCLDSIVFPIQSFCPLSPE